MSTPFGRGTKQNVKPMPGFVKSALAKAKMMDTYRARPEYQRHEYLARIDRAIGTDAKKKLLDQMIDELTKGGVYLGEPWEPPAPVKS